MKSVIYRAACIAGAAAFAFAAAGCTTTVRQVAQTRPLTQNSSPSAMSELHIADTALESNNLELATSLYERIVQADPNSVPGLTGLGSTLYAVGDYTRAGVYFERASKLDAQAIAPLVGIGRVAIHQRRFDDAIATYRRVLAMKPNDPLASAGLGAALDLSGKHAEAQAVLRDALAANPGDPVLSLNLGLSLTLGGDPRQGANVLLDVTRFPAAPPQARQDLALAYGLLGNDDAAAAILSTDLPKDSVQDNLRFYQLQRTRAAQNLALKGVTVSEASVR
ncbi:tetratricopeptide repeat protein [Caballeronia sp. Lep1P3]|uniref:tetratricopeptide repeat protein n=1 Tax=Caballeronia sp. Lep1P3 TaxID=2878150 RepID=UPI001FD5A8B6|nr:tetratricopeptide repeat protein [Caballeronia sp. Lep1P3]